MKVTKTKTEEIEMELDFPIYSISEGFDDDTVIYTKITESRFLSLKMRYGSIEIFKCKTPSSIDISYIENQVSAEEWNEQLEHTKKLLNSFDE